MLVRQKIPMIPRNAFIAAGAVIFAYILVKIFKSKSDKTSKTDSDTEEPKEITQEETTENTTESTQPIIKVVSTITQMKKLKPNFFLAFQVNDVGIHKKIKELQEKIIAKNPLLFQALVKVSTLHVTLAVTHLANETDIKSLKSKLDEWAEKNVETFFKEPCIVSFTGVKTFTNVVAYVDMEQCSNYKKIFEISNSFRKLLTSNGFTVDKKNITPHMTFLKLTKDIKLLRLKKDFKNDFESLKKIQDHFGKQKVTSIQLLSMDDVKDETGYYECYHKINVADSPTDMDHTECCSPIKKPKALIKKEIRNKFQGSKNNKK